MLLVFRVIINNVHIYSYTIWLIEVYDYFNIIKMCIGRGLMNRRWYDSDKNTEQALDLLKNMDENRRRALSSDLVTVIKQIKELHEEDEEPEISLGIDRVLGLYKISNSRRWYDKVSILSYALKTMSTLPKEDFYNIMEGLSNTLSVKR